MRTAAAAAFLLAALATLGLPAAPAAAQQGGAAMRPVPRSDDVSESDDSFTVDIVAENVDNLGAFLFVLVFDGDVLRATEVTRGDFLESTGREPVCDDPTIDETGVRLRCVTLRPMPDGPDGTGTLATVTFEPVDEGSVTLTLSRAEMLRTNGSALNVTAQPVTLDVSGDGMSWVPLAIGGGAALVLLVVAGAGGALLLRRRSRGASPGDISSAA